MHDHRALLEPFVVLHEGELVGEQACVLQVEEQLLQEQVRDAPTSMEKTYFLDLLKSLSRMPLGCSTCTALGALSKREME